MIVTSSIKKKLDEILGDSTWKDLEVETLILELGMPYSDELFDQVSVLKVVANASELFYTDVSFFIYASEVLNGNAADFDYLPHITSLEAAFAIVEMAVILGKRLNESSDFDTGPKTYIKDLLINEGYSSTPSPFDIVGVGRLTEGQLPQDILDKEKAIIEYCSAMYKE